jgi:hypothetical protein
MTLLALGFWPGFAIGVYLGVMVGVFVAALMAAAVAGEDYSHRGGFHGPDARHVANHGLARKGPLEAHVDPKPDAATARRRRTRCPRGPAS